MNNTTNNLPTFIKNRKYTLNVNYFSAIDSAEKAYWLGFLYADGCVHKNNLIIGLQKNDKDHLLKFAKEIERNTDKLYYNSKTKSYTLTVCSCELVNRLIELGCVPKKSLILKYPSEQQLPKEYNSHFIRGYFDGDGSITHMNGGSNAEICIVGTLEFLTSISKFLEKEGVLFNIYKHKNAKSYYISFASRNSVDAFFNFIYNNSNIRLERKYNKFKSFFEISENLKNKRWLNSKKRYFDKRRNSWIVCFNHNKKRIRTMGSYKTEKEAIDKINEYALANGLPFIT